MTEAEVLTIFRQSGALLEGHFRLSSGLHSPGYLQCALVLQHPRDAETLGAALGTIVRSLGVQTVLSPALGGIVIGQEVARALGVRAIFAERQDGTLTLRRGFTLEPGEKVLVVEDVVTTVAQRARRWMWHERRGRSWLARVPSSTAAAASRGSMSRFTALLPMD